MDDTVSGTDIGSSPQEDRVQTLGVGVRSRKTDVSKWWKRTYLYESLRFSPTVRVNKDRPLGAETIFRQILKRKRSPHDDWSDVDGGKDPYTRLLYPEATSPVVKGEERPVI